MAQINAVQWWKGIASQESSKPSSPAGCGWLGDLRQNLSLVGGSLLGGALLAHFSNQFPVHTSEASPVPPTPITHIALQGHVFAHGCKITTGRVNGSEFTVQPNGDFTVQLPTPEQNTTAHLAFAAPRCTEALQEITLNPHVATYQVSASIFPQLAMKPQSRPKKPNRSQLANHKTRRKMGRVGKLIEQYAAQSGLNPALVYAVVHTESNFDTHAHSQQNAVGLMQLVPETGALAAVDYLDEPLRNASASNLKNPETNLRLGVGYLQLLSDRYFHKIEDDKARLALVLAAYNWGPGNVKSLLKKSRHTPRSLQEVKQLLRERAPKETSRYVQQVTERMAFYEQLV